MAALDAALATQAAEQRVADAEEAVQRGDPGADEQLHAAEEALDQALEATVDAEFDGDDEDDDEDGGEEEEDGDGAPITRSNLFAPVPENNSDDEQESPPPDSSAEPPNNFSSVDLSRPQAELANEFPLLAAATCFEVTVNAGQTLYLPAGWFHEVTSFGSKDGHMALNYWWVAFSRSEPHPHTQSTVSHD
jgi:hypothetical protein